MLEPLRVLTGKAAPLDSDDVDTDQILPAQFLKVTEKKGLAKYLFYRWRHDERGSPLETFVLDRREFQDAKVLVAGRNFGIGSSRENAVWALTEFGIRCVVSSSFGDIFYNNASKNGLLCVRIPDEGARSLREASRSADLIVTIDVGMQLISWAGNQLRFDIEPHVKERLLLGADEVGYTLKNYEKEILAYESRMRPYLIPRQKDQT